MVKFEDALDVSPLDDGDNWRVLEDFYYDTDVELTPLRGNDRRWPRGVECWARGWRIQVEKGFVTDFASIPRPLWFLVGAPAEGKYRKIAVIHDKLYRTKGLATRRQSDAVLLEGMKCSGVNWLTRWEVYLGVRLFGHFNYKGGL